MLELNFKKYGNEGPTFIILHGLFGMLDNWQQFAKALVKHSFQVYSVDQRDHGRSPKTEDFDYKIIAQDIKDFFDQHSIEKAHLIGHSMGGKSVMRFTLDFPEHVLSQTIVDMAPRAYPSGHEHIFDALQSLDITEIESRVQASDHLNQFLKNQAVSQFLLKNLDRRKEGGFQWKMNLNLLIKNYPNILSKIYSDEELSYIPSLFVGGGKSNYISSADVEEIENLFPNNSFEVIAESGHWIHAEKPDELLELILDFID